MEVDDFCSVAVYCHDGGDVRSGDGGQAVSAVVAAVVADAVAAAKKIAVNSNSMQQTIKLEHAHAHIIPKPCDFSLCAKAMRYAHFLQCLRSALIPTL